MKLGILSAPRIGPASVGAVLDPLLRNSQAAEVLVEGSQSKTPKQERLSSMNDLFKLSKDLGYPEIKPEEEDFLDDLDLYNQITQGQAEVERLSDIETEILETQMWNHDAGVQLLNVALGANDIPFGTRAELFNLKPTAEQETSKKWKGKGKEKEKETETETEGTEAGGNKRAIFNLSPEVGKPFWCGSPNREFYLNHLPSLLICWSSPSYAAHDSQGTSEKN